MTDPEKIGIITLLLLSVIGFLTERVVPGGTHRRVVAERDQYLASLLRSNELLGRASVGAVQVAQIMKEELVKPVVVMTRTEHPEGKP